MDQSCIISEIKEDIGQKSQLFIAQLHSIPGSGGLVRIIKLVRKTATVALSNDEESLKICLLVSIQYRMV